jgi:hypothetical protein
LIFLSGCNSPRETSKFEFQSSRYYTSVIPARSSKVYVNVEEDIISVHPIQDVDQKELITENPDIIFTEHIFQEHKIFHNPLFDTDLLTIPIKFLFAQQDVPNQLTTNF